MTHSRLVLMASWFIDCFLSLVSRLFSEISLTCQTTWEYFYRTMLHPDQSISQSSVSPGQTDAPNGHG